ncbi:MAG: orotate phosphoribosyltransferase, partial [Myxococcota bacterium]
LDAVYVRKQAKGHGSRKQFEGADHLAGKRLAILEDTVTTGGSTLRAAEALRAGGFELAGVVAVVDRVEGAREAIEAAGLPFVSLYRRRDFMGDEP